MVEQIVVVNVATGEADTRPLTLEEQAQRAADLAAAAEADRAPTPTLEERIAAVEAALGAVG